MVAPNGGTRRPAEVATTSSTPSCPKVPIHIVHTANIVSYLPSYYGSAIIASSGTSVELQANATATPSAEARPPRSATTNARRKEG